MGNLQSMEAQFLNDVERIIEENMSNEDFSVSFLAKEAGLSRSMLHRRLIRLTGKSATQLITELRLSRANELIENKVATVSEIAYMVGFASPSYFNKVFKKYYGISPGEVKKKGAGTERPRLSLRVKEAGTVKMPKLWRIVGLLSIAIIVTLIILNLIQKNKVSRKPEFPEKSIAVLPLSNDSPNLGNVYFISGMMECILSNLCKIEDLIVHSRSSVERFRDTILPVPEVADILNVNYLLLGSVERYGDKIRLTFNLVDRKDRQLWSEQYVRSFTLPEDYYELQSEIARKVASALHATITPEELLIIDKKPTANIRALGLYRQGREEYIKYCSDDSDKVALQNAIKFYRSALLEDPEYGQAYASMAMAVLNLYWMENRINKEFSEKENQLYQDSILQLVNSALERDKQLEEAFLVRGDYYQRTGEFKMALEECEKALQINPNYGGAFNSKSDIMFYEVGDWIEALVTKLKAVELEQGDMQLQLLSELGDYYEMMGFSDKAEELYSQTLEITGDSARYYFDMGGTAYCARNWNERISWFKKSLRLDPDPYWALAAISNSYIMLGNLDSAIHFASLLQKKEEFAQEFRYSGLAKCYALLGKPQLKEVSMEIDKREKYLRDLVEYDIGKRDNYIPSLAEIYCIKDQTEKAMETLSQIKLHTVKPLWYIITLEEDPIYESIRGEYEFQTILRSLNSTWQTEHERVRQWMVENQML